MPKTKATSPARSQGGTTTPKRKSTRGSRSLCSPALSTASGRLTSLVDQFKDKNMESFALSPLNGRSVLNDNTEIEEPRRKSWWKKLDENSQEVMEVLEDNKLEVNNPIEELSEIEVLSQGKKNYTLGLPESSDNESIHSIVLPQRRLFTQKENQSQKKYGHLIDNRESLAKLHKTNNTNIDKTLNVGTRELFQNAKRSKPIFPAALLNISPNKTAADKTRENMLADPKPQVRNIFGSRPANKRKNMFADFIVSESEDEIPDIQPKVFGFQKKLEQRRISSVSRGREASPSSSITTDIEMDFGMLLPSSTMVDNQLEDSVASTPVKRARLSKLSEAKESEAGTLQTNTSSDRTKQSNKSTSSKNKSKASPEMKDKSLNRSRTTRSMLKNASKLEESVNTSLKQDAKGNKSKSKISSTGNELDSSLSKTNSNESNKHEKEHTVTIKEHDKRDKSLTNDKEQNEEEDDENNLTLEYENDDEVLDKAEISNENQKNNTRKHNTVVLEKDSQETEINRSRSNKSILTNKSSLTNKSNLSNKSVQKSAKTIEESVESQTEQYFAKDNTRKHNTVVLENDSQETEINRSRSNKSSLTNKSSMSNKSNLSNKSVQKSAKTVEESVESQTEQYSANDNVDGNHEEAAVANNQESNDEEMVDQEIQEVANNSRESSNEEMEHENEDEVNVSEENAEVNESVDNQEDVNVSQENEDEQNESQEANESQELEDEQNESQEANESQELEDEQNESQEANESHELEDEQNESQEANESHELEDEQNESQEVENGVNQVELEEEEGNESEKEEDEANESEKEEDENESQKIANENQEEEDLAEESQEVANQSQEEADQAHESQEVENEKNQSKEDEEEGNESEKEKKANESQKVANENQEEENQAEQSHEAANHSQEEKDQANESQEAHESQKVENEETQSEEEEEEGNESEKEEDEDNESEKEEDEVNENQEVANESQNEADQANGSQELEPEVNESQEIEEEEAKESQEIEEEANDSEDDEEVHESHIVDDDEASEQEDEEEMDEDEEEVVNEATGNESQEVENDEEESREVESDAEVNESLADEDDRQMDDSEEAVKAVASDPDISDDNQADEMEVDDDEQESDDADESEQNEHVSHEDRQIEEQNEIEPSEDIEESPNVTHDTTGRHRKKHLNKSPEVILHDKTNQMDSFIAKGRNTSVRKTKSMINNLNIKPSLAPPRDSIGFSDGTTNSSAEGSGWDSHRTTRKTLRQTFGKDFTPRKSLRALVMEKSAKRQTEHMEMQSETLKFPLANSTEMPENSLPVEDDVESDHEASRITRLATLEQYLQKIKEQNIAKNLKMEAAIRNSFKTPITNSLSLFKVPNKPAPRRPNPAQSKPKKQIKSNTAFGPLPPEVIEDMKYKPPKRFKPSNASWVTKRLYKYLENKLEPKYDYRARVRAEKLVETIYFFTKDIRRHYVAPPDAVDVLKHEFARLEIVQTHYEFYEFFHEFMPREVRVKVVPDIVNKIAVPRHGVFSDILREKIIVHE